VAITNKPSGNFLFAANNTNMRVRGMDRVGSRNTTMSI
jgi:hypothetical protein